MTGKWLIPLCLSAALIDGCATKDDIIEETGPTMSEIYHRHMDTLHRRHDPREVFRMREVSRGGGDLSGWTRTQASEIGQVFPALPNPTLVMYVFPHLSPAGTPVPGYATAFPMYETTRYALPGEVAP